MALTTGGRPSKGDHDTLKALRARLQRAERSAAEATARAEKIKSANDALRRSAGQLAAGDGIDSYLGQVLLSIVEELGGMSGTVYTYDAAANVNWLRACVSDGRAVPARQADHPYASKPMPFRGTPDSVFPNWGTPEVSYFQHEVSEESGLEPEYVAYVRASGARVNLVVPIALNGELLGLFAVRFSERRQFSDEDSELFKALAHQAAIAVRLWQLGEQARDAAVARERDEGEGRRAHALERISRAERETLERLAKDPDFERFLENVLLVAVAQFEAIGAGVWLVEDEVLRLQIIYEDRELRRPHQSRHPKARDGFPLRDFPELTARLRGGEITLMTSHDFATERRYDSVREFLTAEGIQCGVNVPMYFGSDYRGLIFLGFDHARGLTDVERDLARSLANQAVLAIQMARMAARERESALAAERGRLAREIHDTLAQGFAAIAMRLTTVQREYADRAPSEVAKAIADAADVARGYIVESRRAFAALKFQFEYESLAVGLEHLIDAFRRSGEHRIQLHVAPIGAVPDAVAFELLRIVREALNNALRHAGAHGIRVELMPTPEEDGVRLVVADDGAGFDPDGPVAGFGLTSMRERVEEIGATLTLISAPGEGTEIIVTWYARGLQWEI